jgi:hypothetical protein
VVVGPDAEIARGDAAFRTDGGGFSEDHACAADGAAAEVDEMPVRGVAVHRAVLAHGRDSDSVGEGDGALGERGEKMNRGFDGGGHGVLDEGTPRRMRGVLSSGFGSAVGFGLSGFGLAADLDRLEQRGSEGRGRQRQEQRQRT